MAWRHFLSALYAMQSFQRYFTLPVVLSAILIVFLVWLVVDPYHYTEPHNCISEIPFLVRGKGNQLGVSKRGGKGSWTIKYLARIIGCCMLPNRSRVNTNVSFSRELDNHLKLFINKTSWNDCSKNSGKIFT